MFFFQTCNVLGHASSAHSPIISGLNSTDRKNQHAIDIVESLPGTCDVTVFGYSTCPNFRYVNTGPDSVETRIHDISM